MGFYVRKSIKAGPFRFNVSKSGLGVSAGVPGFRIGTGPRGNYVHAGRGGLYYRASLGQPRRSSRSAPPPRQVVPSFTPSDGIAMTDVTGASAEELHPTGSGDLVEQLNAAARRVRLAPWLCALLFVILVAKPVVGVILLVPGIAAGIWLHLRDQARRSVVAFYDVNDDVERWFDRMVAAFEELGTCERVWRINAAGRIETTYQYKVNAGASKLVDRADARISFEPPKIMKTNIKAPTVTVGKTSISFLPDRVLLRSGRKFSDAKYSDLQTAAYDERFIESDRVPRDSQQVDTTWLYVNVKGGPDRRFKNNRQLPIVLYGRLEIASSGGLFWILDLSRARAGKAVAREVSNAPTVLNTAQEQPNIDPMPASLPAPA